MSVLRLSIFGGEADYGYPEDHTLYYEPEEPEVVLEFILSLVTELIERTIPEPKRVLTFEKAAKCLSLLGKIWNLTECPEGCEVDSIACETSDERLLDMEGYVEEYQYLHLKAVDMALSDIRIIPQHYIWLLSVDVSGNRLTNISACPLTKLPNIVSIKLDRNRIVDPYLESMKHLQYLGMNSNQIESMHRIYHPNLLTLDLNWNKITKIDSKDCWKLAKLTQLELRGNHLSTTAGLEYTNLVNLYLAENEITKLEGMNYLPNLQRLHLRSNPLSDLSGLADTNPMVQYVNLRSCKIEEVNELEHLQRLTGLRVLIVKDNLFNPSPELEDGGEEEDDDDDEIRLTILLLLPQLTRINKRVVTKDEMKNVNEMLEEQELS